MVDVSLHEAESLAGMERCSTCQAAMEAENGQATSSYSHESPSCEHCAKARAIAQRSAEFEHDQHLFSRELPSRSLDDTHTFVGLLDIGLLGIGALAGYMIGVSHEKAWLGVTVGICVGGLGVIILEYWESMMNKR